MSAFVTSENVDKTEYVEQLQKLFTVKKLDVVVYTLRYIMYFKRKRHEKYKNYTKYIFRLNRVHILSL